jgi:hypothetical protein
MIALIISGALALVGYVTTRNYVRSRLRYVDAVQKPTAPLVAGAIFAALAWPFAWLHLIGVGTALLFGASVGIGVASGARDIRRGNAGLLEP